LLFTNSISLLIILFVTFLFCVFVSNVGAIVPQVQDVSVLKNNDDVLLDVTFFHNPVTDSHHSDEIEVDIDGVITNYQISQDSTTFTAQLNLGPVSGSPQARVRVYCNVDGWSSWTNQQTIPEFSGYILVLVALTVIMVAGISYKKKMLPKDL